MNSSEEPEEKGNPCPFLALEVCGDSCLGNTGPKVAMLDSIVGLPTTPLPLASFRLPTQAPCSHILGPLIQQQSIGKSSQSFLMFFAEQSIVGVRDGEVLGIDDG
jgi:hypothetical protein